MRRFLFASVVGIVATSWGCGGGNAPAPTSPAAPSQTTVTRVISLSGNLAFGSVSVGQSATAILTISNSGNATLTWSGLASGTPCITASPSSGSVPAGGTASATVTFAPAAASTYSGTITVTSDATGGTNTVAFSGTGVKGGSSQPSPTRVIRVTGNLTFGNVSVGQSRTLNITIANTGNAKLTWRGLTASGSIRPVLTANPAKGTVAPGASVKVGVRFTPVSVATYSGTVTVDSDATSGPSSIPATGTGTAPATRIMTLSPRSLLFAPGVTRMQFSILNSGNATLTFTDIQPDGPGFTASPTRGSVAPGGAASITVTFSPTTGAPMLASLWVVSDRTNTSYPPFVSCAGQR